jgi:hypothetical protein
MAKVRRPCQAGAFYEGNPFPTGNGFLLLLSHREHESALLFFFVQLILNVLWSLAFFGLGKPPIVVCCREQVAWPPRKRALCSGVVIMVDYSQLREHMGQAGLDALIAVDPRNMYYLVGYMDPGNWATDIAGGARFG